MNSSKEEIKIKYKQKIPNEDKENQNPNEISQESIKFKTKIKFADEENPIKLNNYKNNILTNLNSNNNNKNEYYSNKGNIDNNQSNNYKKNENEDDIKNKNNFREFLHDEKIGDIEKSKIEFLNFYMNKDKIDYSKIPESNIKFNDISNNQKDKQKFLLGNKINVHLNMKKNQLHEKIENSMSRLNKGNCYKFLWACLAFIILPITIMLICLILELFSGFLYVIIGSLLILTIIALPILLALYFKSKDKTSKEFYWFIISLSWLSFWIIIKGIYIIIKGILLSIYLFFKSFYLICNGQINHVNTFGENIRIGLGQLKLKPITELDQMFAKKEKKTSVIL